MPESVGVKVTLIVQEIPAETDAPQSLVCAKSPDATMPLSNSGAVPALDNVTV